MNDVAHAATRVGADGERLAAIRTALGAVIQGKPDAIELLLVGVLAGGHVLVEDVPGVGKTTLAKTLARVFAMSYSRVQFTPDLLPADIIGAQVLDPRAGSFSFHKGPVFTNVLLADEINRASPRTQSALLEAMSEAQVTVDGVTYELPRPFFVLATQNPIEQEGTYPLPEAQLDRFLVQIDVGYPSEAEEIEIVRRTTAPASETPSAVMAREEILALQELVPRVPVASHVIAHAVAIARATRPAEGSAPAFVKQYVAFGAGPRASQALVLGAKARAVLAGRFAAEIEDVRALAPYVLRHRLVPSFRAEAEGVRAPDVVETVLREVRP